MTPLERQNKRRKKMNEKNFYLVQVWVPKEKIIEIKATAASMKEGWKEELKPTQDQLALAQFLCDTKGLRLSQTILASTKNLAKWLKKNQTIKKGSKL